MATASEIGQWLRKGRQRARLRARKQGRRDFSIEKVAQRLGVTERTVRQWEKGTNPPPTDHFLAMAGLYEADIHELMADSSKPRRGAMPPDPATYAPVTRSDAAAKKRGRAGSR